MEKPSGSAAADGVNVVGEVGDGNMQVDVDESAVDAVTKEAAKKLKKQHKKGQESLLDRLIPCFIFHIFGTSNMLLLSETSVMCHDHSERWSSRQ